MEKETLFNQIQAHLDKHFMDTVHYDMIKERYPAQGEIVIAHRFMGKPHTFDHHIARVVQIRLKCGQFGSNMYFLRMPTGELITAENQSYRKIPEQFIDEVEAHFSTDLALEQEGFDKGYSIGGEHLEQGFIIEKTDTPGTPDTPFGITITTT